MKYNTLKIEGILQNLSDELTSQNITTVLCKLDDITKTISKQSNSRFKDKFRQKNQATMPNIKDYINNLILELN